MVVASYSFLYNLFLYIFYGVYLGFLEVYSIACVSNQLHLFYELISIRLVSRNNDH